jgi:hypothetical protein
LCHRRDQDPRRRRFLAAAASKTAISSSISASITTLAAALGSAPSQLLTRDNALIWKALVIPALRGAHVLDLVEGSEKPPEKLLETEDINKKKVTIPNPEYAAWISRDQHVLRWILNALSPDVLVHVVGMETSAEAWAAINDHVSSSSKSRVQQLRSALNDTRKNDLSADKYFAKMKCRARERPRRRRHCPGFARWDLWRRRRRGNRGGSLGFSFACGC